MSVPLTTRQQHAQIRATDSAAATQHVRILKTRRMGLGAFIFAPLYRPLSLAKGSLVATSGALRVCLVAGCPKLWQGFAVDLGPRDRAFLHLDAALYVAVPHYASRDAMRADGRAALFANQSDDPGAKLAFVHVTNDDKSRAIHAEVRLTRNVELAAGTSMEMFVNCGAKRAAELRAKQHKAARKNAAHKGGKVGQMVKACSKCGGAYSGFRCGCTS